MAYTKNTWKTGDIVSSQKLNHMEGGIAGAYEVMVINDTDGTLDKTWQEIYDAMVAGTFCVVKKVEQKIGNTYARNYPVVEAVNNEMDGTYNVSTTFNNQSGVKYTTTSATGYPQEDKGSFS